MHEVYAPLVRAAIMVCTALLAACASLPVPSGAVTSGATSAATPAKTHTTKAPAAASSYVPPSPSLSLQIPQDNQESWVTSRPLVEDVSVAADTTQGALSMIPAPWSEKGIASWYGPRFHGRRTANGERFNTHELTAAHKTLPFGARVRVTSLLNGKEVVVRINDRGPFIKGRIIDLSKAAALELGLTGVKPVRIEQLPKP